MEAPIRSPQAIAGASFVIQAAGKVLSSANEEALKKAYTSTYTGVKQLETVLESAGVLDRESIQAAGAENDIQAEAFEPAFRRASFFNDLKILSTKFSSLFVNLHEQTDEELIQQYGTEAIKNRGTLISQAIDDFVKLARKLSSNHPGISEDAKDRYVARRTSGYGDDDYMYMSAAKQYPEITPEHTLDLHFEAPVIQASGVESPSKNENLHPIRGVLFQVDCVSQSSPSVGSPLPLFITKAAAEKMLGYGIAYLPLDADDSLKKHANDKITGVIAGGSIDDKNVNIDGFLYGWSQPSKTATIAAFQGKLGMSMNARALQGEVAEIDGKLVYRIDDLQLLGANILYKSLATYQNTAIAATQYSTPPPNDSPSELHHLDAIAASAFESSTPTDETPMNDQVLLQLSNLTESINRDGEAKDKRMTKIEETLTALTAIVSEIQSERKQHQETLQAQASVEEEAKRQQELVTALVQSFEPKFNEIDEKLKVLQTSGRGKGLPPNRITSPLGAVPLAAGAGPATPEQTDPKTQAQFALFQLEQALISEKDPNRRINLITQKAAMQEAIAAIA